MTTPLDLHSENNDPTEENDFYEHYRIVVDKGQELLRIDKFLINRLESTSRNKIQQAAKADCIVVNDKPVKVNYKVKPNDVISVLLPHPPCELEVIGEDIPLDIVYEDADVLVVNKPANMVVHPGYGNFTGTLLNGLVYYFQNKHDGQGNAIVPYLSHRIDKDTTGLLLIAKNETAQTVLAKQFYDHSVSRQYLALVWGDFTADSGTIEGYLGRSAQDRRIMTVYADGETGKHSVTHWQVVERFGYVTLLRCVLETGRTHQIRAHMRSIAHPLFGDSTYGGDRILKGTTFSKYKQFITNCFKTLPRQALHAQTLGFVHPTTGKSLSFESAIPNDMAEVLDKWRRYTQHHDAPEDEVVLTDEDTNLNALLR